MNEHYYKRSEITNRTYDIFSCCKLLNIRQIIHYLKNHICPMDIQVSQDKNGNDVLVFTFDKEETRELYKKWCEKQQEVNDDNK